MELKNLNRVRKKKADGSFVVYWYAWKGGPRLHGEPGSPSFVQSYAEALHRRRGESPPECLGAVLDAYLASEEFLGLAPRTRKDYQIYARAIRAEFGDFPAEALVEDESRTAFLEWRDKLAKRSKRGADYAWTVLARVLSWARGRRRIKANPCERGGRVYKGAARVDAIWTTADEAAFMAVASPQLRLAFLLAIWTGQRQGDILRLTWEAYDGAHIRLTQQKTGRRVVILAGAPLKAALDAVERRSSWVVAGQGGRPFTSDGFKTSFRRACARASIKGLTFHDLRGSTVTRLAEAQATEIEIAAITGHSISDVKSILDGHYLSRTRALGDSAIQKLEGHTNG